MAGEQAVTTFIVQSEEFLQNRHVFYKPLNPSKREVRLMYMESGQEDDDIRITLSTVDLEDEPFYEIISYTWEDLWPTKQVYLHGQAYNVTVNQHAALRRLRLPHETKVLWMDVVCIDQADLQERAHQVSIMGDIYTNAAVTDVWLGDLTENWYSPMSDEDWDKTVAEFDRGQALSSVFKISPSALREELMSKFLKISGSVERTIFILDQLAADIHVDSLPYCSMTGEEMKLCRPWYDTVNVLLKILQRPWWTRVWVLQEVFLCKGDPRLLFGPFVLPFNVFMKAADTYLKHTVIERCCVEAVIPIFLRKEVLDHLSSLILMSSIITIDKPGNMPLEKAVQLTKGRNATDIRDYLYGVLGLVSPEERVKVDYTLTIKQLFASASWHMFRLRNDFTSLDRGSLPGGARTPGIPTWSIDWTEVDRIVFKHNRMFDMDEEPDWERTKYDGDLEVVANQLAEIRSIFPSSPDDDKSTDCRNHHTRLWSWLKNLTDAGFETRTAEWTADKYQNEPFFFEFFATIFRDTAMEFEDATNIAVLRLQKKEWREIRRWWNRLNKCFNSGTEQKYPGTKRYMTALAFLAGTNGSNLAVTTEHKLCMVPEFSEPQDLIYHIRACRTPIVLREASPSTFQVVGPAFLRGSMGSEGWRKEDEKMITLK